MRLLAVILACAATSAAWAQDIMGFDRADFGQVVLSQRQTASADIQLELAVGDYNNEYITNYSASSIFARFGRSVGRLDVLTDAGIFPCTAFIVSKQYIVTNHHCVPGILDNPDAGATRIQAVQFVAGYTLEGVEEGTRIYQVNAVPVEANKELDYAVLEVFGDPSADWGKLDVAALQPNAKDPYWVIGHPMGEAQRISREKCRAADPVISRGVLRHTCDTLPGNSGSPVIDASQQVVVALHHAGSRRNSINYAIPMQRILEASPILAALRQPTSQQNAAQPKAPEPVGTAPSETVPIVATPKVAEPTAPKPEGPTEKAVFDAAAAIGTQRAWQIYLRRFPDGAFQDFALAEMERLGVAQMVRKSGGTFVEGRPTEIARDVARTAEAALGMTRETAREVQAKLNALGYNVGTADGVIGPATRKGLARFQLQVGLPASGVLTQATALALGIEASAFEHGEVALDLGGEARKYDPEQLALIEDDPKLIKAVRALQGYELVYGYHENRLYLGVMIWQHLDFDNAQSLAERAGGYLATITSKSENDFLFNLVKDDRRFWKDCTNCADFFGPSLGLYQLEGSREPDGGWVWVTGEPMTFTAWAPGEPGNHRNREYFGNFIYWGHDKPDNGAFADDQWGDLPFSSHSLLIEIE